MAARRIVILTHQQQGLSPGAFLHRIAFEHWRAEGIEVLLQQGLKQAPPAPLAILHVDLTRMPDAYARLADSYPRCLNGRLLDISKRCVSDGLLTREDPYDGPVVVKTDLNHAGLPERRLALALGGRRAALAEGLRARLPSRLSGRLPGDRYRLYARKEAVPAWVWRSPALVVERLRSERIDGLHAMNMYYFLGAVGCIATSLSSDPLVKARNTVRRLPLHETVPAELLAARRRLGMDYGKIDYVLEPDGPRLLDANPTPHQGPAGMSDRGREICRRLAAGIDSFFDERGVAA